MHITSKQSKTIKVMRDAGWLTEHKFRDPMTGKTSVAMSKNGSKIKVTAAGSVKNLEG